MSKTSETIRVIQGVRYRCRDIGCDDFDRARLNRILVSYGLFTTGMERIENAVRSTPLGKPLPSWIPLGELPRLSRGEWNELSGGDLTEG